MRRQCHFGRGGPRHAAGGHGLGRGDDDGKVVGILTERDLLRPRPPKATRIGNRFACG